MKLLVVGSGAREHALVWKLAQTPATDIVAAPGNPGMARIARCEAVDAGNPEAVLALARQEQVDLTVIGPEAPLERGVADLFELAGLALLGPSQAAARLETSKAFAKEFMVRHDVPTARFEVCENASDAFAAIDRKAFGYPLVIKADGLAAGKGVIIAANRIEAQNAVSTLMVKRQFGEAGSRVVLEEYLSGREVSFFVLSDGSRAVPLVSAEDHKRAYDGDSGPNTGGMGAFAPSRLVDEEMRKTILRRIVRPVLAGMRGEGSEYRGFLYVGLMITAHGPHVIEFNVRLGDPEAQVVLPMLSDDLPARLLAAATGRLGPEELAAPNASPHVGVVIASGGYPGHYEVGKPIHGVEQAEALEGVVVLHAGTSLRHDQLMTAGGRVLTIVGRGDTFDQAIARAYQAVDAIDFEGKQVRRDIGRRALN
jgi:phosphoribosylamine--glycine ligase